MARKPNRRIVQGRCAGCGQDRPLKYNRRTMCAYYKCAEAAKRAVAARRDSEGDDGSVVCDQEEEEFCFKVTKVLGQRDCDAENLSRVQRRNKLADDDQRVAYLILGTFGETESDTGEVDTRWVEAIELKEKISQAKLKTALQAYAKRVAALV